jgi:hypothetical protein
VVASESIAQSCGEGMGERNRMRSSIGRDIPSLTDALLRVFGSNGGVSPFGDHPLSLLCAYLSSLNEICEQALYAMERLSVFVSEPPDRSSDLHAKYHLYGFLSRARSRKPRSVVAHDLAATVDKARNEWIGPFYELRNMVIHRNALALVRAPYPHSTEYHAFLAPAGLLASATDRQVVEQFLRRLGLVEGPLASSTVIEPVDLCEQLWARLATLVDSVLARSGPQIDCFVSGQRAAGKGNTLAED